MNGRLVLLVGAASAVGMLTAALLTDTRSNPADQVQHAGGHHNALVGEPAPTPAASRLPPSTVGITRIRQAKGTLPMDFDAGEYLALNVGDRATLCIPRLPGELRWQRPSAGACGSASDPAPPSRDETSRRCRLVSWQVDHRQQHANGDISLVGELQDRPGTVVLTLGQRHSFATISVNGRIFNMSADASGAWIANAAELGVSDANDTLQPAVPVAPRPRLIASP